MHDVIHEWAGDACTVLGLVRAHIERRVARGNASDLFLIAPSSADDLTDRLRRAGAKSVVGVLGLAKLLDSQAAAAVFARLLDRRGTLRVTHGATDPDTLVFEGDRCRAGCTASELLPMLFAPKGERSGVLEFADRLGLPAHDLPLALFAWGLDSI